MDPTSDAPPSAMPDKSLEAVYEQLRGIAAAMLDREIPGHTLQPTALVNEAYVRLAAQQNLPGYTRDQLLGLGATMIRRVLVDHYRRKHALKRGGGSKRVQLDAGVFYPVEGILALEDALAKFEKIDPAKANLVVLKFFGGLSVDQISQLVGDSPRKVARDWAFARAWLGRELSE